MTTGKTLAAMMAGLLLSASVVFAQSGTSAHSAGTDLQNKVTAPQANGAGPKKGSEMSGEIIAAAGLMSDGKYSQALETLAKVTENEPQNDAAWYYTGLCQMYLRNIEEAGEALKKASELDPGNYWYKDRLAVAYSLSGESELATATYEDLLKDFPKKTDLYYNLVNLYLGQGQMDKALEALSQIETVFGKSEQVTGMKYDILLRQAKPDEAMKALEEFNEEFSSPYVLTKMGDHSMAEYKDSAALAYFREALTLQSDYVPAILGEAEVHRIRRDYPEFFGLVGKFIDDEESPAETKTQYLEMFMNRTEPRLRQSLMPQIDSLYERLVQRYPTDSSVLVSSGLYWYGTERRDKAVEAFRANMNAHPDNLGCAISYIQVLSYIEDWEALKDAADNAFARFPEEPGLLDMKTYACYNLGDWQGVIDNNQRIIDIAQGDTSLTIPAMANIGDMYHEMGYDKEAYSYYKKVLKLNPDYAPTLNNYAYYLSEEGKKLKKACEMSRRSLLKEPDNVNYLDTYGWILHLLGKDAEAKTQFKRAMMYGGKDSAVCLEHYAIVLEALGETDLAKVYYKQAETKRAEGNE